MAEIQKIKREYAMSKSEIYKATMSETRARIAEAKRRGTKRGSIGYYGCIDICNTLYDILQDAEKMADRGEYYLAFSIVTLIIVNNAKLASHADDSSGCVGDVQCFAETLMEKICNTPGIKDTEIADEIMAQAIKDCRNTAFDGWEDFSYSILLSASNLSTQKNISKLYATLEKLADIRKTKEYSCYQEWDCLVRINAIQSVFGTKEAEEFANAHLKYCRVRRIAVEMAMARGDDRYAEKLCTEIINERGRNSHWANEWFELLLRIYEKSENTEAQMSLLREMLVDKHDAKRYEAYKALLQEHRKWETEREPLLDELECAIPYHSFAEILWKENKELRLLELLKKHPSIALDYAEKFGTKYSEDTFPLCIAEIEYHTSQATNRKEYKKICREIKRLSQCGADVQPLIAKLKTDYPRRVALIDELERLQLK